MEPRARVLPRAELDREDRARIHREQELIIEIHGLVVFVPGAPEPSTSDQQTIGSGHVVMVDAQRAGGRYLHTPALVFDSFFLHPETRARDLMFILDPTMLDCEDRATGEPCRDRQWAVWPLHEKTIRLLHHGHPVPPHRGSLRARCLENLPDMERVGGAGRIRPGCIEGHPPRPHPHPVAARLELTFGLIDACAVLPHTTSFAPKHKGRCYSKSFARHLTYRTHDPNGIFELQAKGFGDDGAEEALVLDAGADGPVRAFVSNMPAVPRIGHHMRSYYALADASDPTLAMPYRNSTCTVTTEPEGDGVGCSPAKMTT